MEDNEIERIIKSIRDLMRKDKGMNTDAQRLPQMLWMLFLKCFDDYEKGKEILGNYEPIIEPPYRWRDWSDDEKGPRGEMLIDFVENKLFKYLSNLHGDDSADQRDVIGDIFSEQKNFMTDGYSVKEVISQINKLDFTTLEHFHLIGTAYERLLSSMKDNSPGTFGEFYTPRPLIKFIVKMINPSLKNRETILDPAAGSCGFLIESFTHMEDQVTNTKENEFLQKHALSGIEARPDPYLFGIMNMMLHGVLEPNLVRANTLETPLRDINEKLRVNVIMTNPPFGGEELPSIKRKFPAGFQTQDTTLGFMLHCMERLKDGGRCAIIVNDNFLSAGQMESKIKEKLLKEFNLHTIVRLPRSVFAPYTPIATNILFFEKNGMTKDIWYYNVPKREGYKSFNKTNPIKFENLEPVLKWAENKKNDSKSWKKNIEEIKKSNYNLDVKHPDADKMEEMPSPDKLIDDLIKQQKQISDLLKIVKEKMT